MGEQSNLDLSKVIGLIMENPQLIEQISNLARQNTGPESDRSKTPTIVDREAEEPANIEPTTPTYTPINSSRGNRAQLLCALKPYVSQERAKAIDSMISIADILDLMKAR